MATWENVTSNMKESLDHLADGWHEIWHKARNAITRFTPKEELPVPIRRTKWGVLSAEMRETEDHIEVAIEAPGMESDHFNVRVDSNGLTLSGKRHYSSERTEGQFHITERAYGSFQRVIPLPCEVEDSAAKAKYRKGVLEITLPKSRAAQPRKITVH